MAEIRKPFAPVNSEARLHNTNATWKKVEKKTKKEEFVAPSTPVSSESMQIDPPQQQLVLESREPIFRNPYMSPSDALLSPCSQLLIKGNKKKTNYW